jgi:DNA-binding CsgD family transcriptional regulator
MQSGANLRAVRTTEVRELPERVGHATRLAGLEAALDDQIAGIAVLDSGGVAIFANRSILGIAARREGLTFDERGRLIAKDSWRRVGALVSSAIQGGAGGFAVVPRATGGPAYVARITSVRGPAPSIGPRRAGEECAVVVVHDRNSIVPSAEEVLREGLGLTPAVARLVAALAAGHDLKSYSHDAGISINTARFHLRHAFHQTGTSTQSQLVRIAVRMVSDLCRFSGSL